MHDAHARWLGMFAWIYAGILAAWLVFGIGSFFYFYGSWLNWQSVPTFDDLASTINSPYVVHLAMFIAFLVLLFGAVITILVTIGMDIRLGRELRSGISPGKRRIVKVSVLSLITSLFGGIFFIPIGAALFGYGLWYAFARYQARTDGSTGPSPLR